MFISAMLCAQVTDQLRAWCGLMEFPCYFESYSDIMLATYKVLISPFDQSEAEAESAEDWARDAGGGNGLSRAAFMDALFELADHVRSMRTRLPLKLISATLIRPTLIFCDLPHAVDARSERRGVCQIPEAATARSLDAHHRRGSREASCRSGNGGGGATSTRR